MNEENRDLDAEAAHKSTNKAPGWSIFLLVALVAHQCEEWWGGPGFSAWAQATLGVDLTPARFLVINAIGLLLFTAGMIGAIRSARLAWLVVTISALLVLNGTIHVLATAAFATYSPGTLTGALLYLPLGGLALFSMFHSLPRPVYWRAVFAGIAIHALATLAALS